MQVGTLFNVWHYIALGVVLFIFLGGIVSAFGQKDKKIVLPMIFSVSLISLLLFVIAIFVVDKYTKEVELYKLKNKRFLNLEKVKYTGYVRNTGKYPIGEVVLEIKLVNKGNMTGNVKAGSFYSPSSFWDFVGAGSSDRKPQTVIHEFVVARNLQPNTSEQINVVFDFPPHFRSVAEYAKVYGH